MKNLAVYLDEFLEEDDRYFEGCKNKVSCGKITERDFMKANRRVSREEEIKNHGKPVNHTNFFKSKKSYSRKDKHKKPIE